MGLINNSMGTMMAAILIGGVGIPVVNKVINENNFTGMTALTMQFVPVGMSVSLLFASFSNVLRRSK